MDGYLSRDFLTLNLAIQRTAAYADIFDFPLTVEEIHRYLVQTRASREEVATALQRTSALVRVGDYYVLPGRECLVEIRSQRAAFSSQLWVQAARYGAAISRLPFIRMVAVTGSLAMNNSDPVQGADIDYLIVTDSGRLWSARALLLLFVRRAGLAGIRLCPNYLVTTRALAFPDHNLYAAHEVAQMIPLSGLECYAEIRWANPWADQYLPNAEGHPRLPASLGKLPTQAPFRPFFEMLLRTPPGAWIEQREMSRKINKLSKQQASSPESYFSADVCKGHADRHAAQSQAAYIERLHNFSPEVEG